MNIIHKAWLSALFSLGAPFICLANQGDTYHFEYQQTGDTTSEAQRVFDDGKNTYLQFPDSAKLPAIFATDCHKTVLLNPAVVQDHMIVKGVFNTLEAHLGLDVTKIRFVGTQQRNENCEKSPADDVEIKNVEPASVLVTPREEEILWLSRPAAGGVGALPIKQVLATEFLSANSSIQIDPDVNEVKKVEWKQAATRDESLRGALKQVSASYEIMPTGQLHVFSVPPEPVKWVLRHGQRIDVALREWAKAGGLRFDWNMDRAWLIPSDTTIEAVTAADAIAQVVQALYASGKPIKLRTYDNNYLEVVSNVPH